MSEKGAPLTCSVIESFDFTLLLVFRRWKYTGVMWVDDSFVTFCFCCVCAAFFLFILVFLVLHYIFLSLHLRLRLTKQTLIRFLLFYCFNFMLFLYINVMYQITSAESSNIDGSGHKALFVRDQWTSCLKSFQVSISEFIFSFNSTVVLSILFILKKHICIVFQSTHRCLVYRNGL